MVRWSQWCTLNHKHNINLRRFREWKRFTLSSCTKSTRSNPSNEDLIWLIISIKMISFSYSEFRYPLHKIIAKL